ncbi:hypothetical protein [Streptomyces sp. CB02923]|uniref:hypothetical protein n=1 Tax=Streptomyces sp. CB02923 TaxID=1718985 RepID=UPI00093AA1D3|nr:hypothetical protein [Streptomyces sp. CB02923]
MSHTTLALGATALFAAGCVWYLPATAALRAGADRPYSHRIAAASCVTFWCTPALVAVLLLTPVPWSALGAVTAAGALTALALLAVSRLQRSREQHEETQRWTTLHQSRPDAPAPAPPRNPGRAQLTFLLYLLPGNIVASVIAATVLLTADSLTRQSAVTATMTAVGISAASLAIAGTRAQATRRH